MAEGVNEQLAPHLVKNAPPSMFYIPDFITAEEEVHIMSQMPSNKWISLSRRRLQAVPAQLTASNVLVASTGLPERLEKPVKNRFEALGIFKDSPHGGVNHCLVNEYLPGQGIMPHEDGAAYHPVVATVSLSGSLVLDVTEKVDHNSSTASSDSILEDMVMIKRSWRIFQEPRSLLVTTGSAYTDTLHGIAEIKEDVDLNETTVANWDLLGDREMIIENGGKNKRTTRISLTYRDVLKYFEGRDYSQLWMTGWLMPEMSSSPIFSI